MAWAIKISQIRATRLAAALPLRAANAPVLLRWEVPMPETPPGKPGSQFPLSSPLGEIFARNANLWFKTHAEMLANVDALTHAWLTRRREGVDSMREAIQHMTECRDPAEMLSIQQDWLSGALRRASDD